MPLTAAENRNILRGVQQLFFQRMIRLCFLGHPYYRRVFKEEGLNLGHFREIDDLSRLPLTHKVDFMGQPEDFRLRLEGVSEVSREEQSLCNLIYTAGSTAKPTPFYDTTHDHFSRINQMKRACEIGGLTANDIVMNLFPLTSVPHQGFLSALWGPFGVGAKVVAGLGGRPYADFAVHNTLERAFELIEKHRVTVLWGIATYVRQVVMQAQARGKDFSAVRLVYAMGESCPAGMREDLRERLRKLGASEVKIINGYGFTEMQGPAVECVEGGGFHIPTPTQYYFEILDPATYEPVPEGAEGLVVITHLNRRGTVLLRYVVGDASALSYETCPHCGCSEPRFTTSPYRVGSLIKVKGTLVNPAAIHEALSRLQPKGLLEYQIAIVKDDSDDRYSTDTLLIRLACNEEKRDQLAVHVRSAVLRVTEVTPRLEFLPPDGFMDKVLQYKFSRFVDERGENQR
jgi:phenylacetate-coenzyme A ligase PaaK-like adenylate-forming protein